MQVIDRGLNIYELAFTDPQLTEQGLAEVQCEKLVDEVSMTDSLARLFSLRSSVKELRIDGSRLSVTGMRDLASCVRCGS